MSDPTGPGNLIGPGQDDYGRDTPERRQKAIAMAAKELKRIKAATPIKPPSNLIHMFPTTGLPPLWDYELTGCQIVLTCDDRRMIIIGQTIDGELWFQFSKPARGNRGHRDIRIPFGNLRTVLERGTRIKRKGRK